MADHESLKLLPTRLPRGFALGDYVVDAWVHDGSTAAIYRAHRIADGRCAAVKLQLPSTVRDTVIGERFEREAEVLWWVRGSAHVVELLDVGMLDDGRRYLVTTWLDGEDLEQQLDVLHDQDQRLTVVRACRIARDLALGLAALHERGVVHLDLQPAHVMVRYVADGVDDVTLVDFGHAADLRGALADMARDEALLGIPAYLAPERARGESPSPSCDIYALGVLLFETVSGACLPSDGWSPETLPRVDALRHGVPPALAELVRACMRREVEQRPASARMVALMLDAIIGALEAGASHGYGRASAMPPQALRTGDTLVGMVVPPAGMRALPAPPSRTEVDPDDTEVGMRLDPVLAEPPVDPDDTEVAMKLEPAVWYEPSADPDDTAVTMVLEPAANEAPTVPDEVSTANLERFAQEGPWWLRWAVAAAVLLILGGTGAWLVQRGETEAKATSAVTASSMAASAVEVRAPMASAPVASSHRDEQASTNARTGLESSKATEPQREAVARVEAVVAVQEAPQAPQAPDVPADDSPEVDERARPAAVSRAACEAVRARADAGKQKRQWAWVLEATRKRGCWSSAELRVARARLRVTALAELGELERCVAEGSKSRDREIAARTALCRNELATRSVDAVADDAVVGADAAPAHADVAVDADVAPPDADAIVDANVAPVGGDVAVDG
jgi:tRNA A-37 threonylcarbamoyl transferase component Bud32